MRFGEGVGAGGGGHRAPARGFGGPSPPDQPAGGMRFQMSGFGSHAGKRSFFLCDKRARYYCNLLVIEP